jgi:hypothetical protein
MNNNKDTVFIGIDNGISGTIGIICLNTRSFIKTPIFVQQDYTKKKKNITRIDTIKLEQILKTWIDQNVFVFIERPMVNPSRFIATESALRSLEATLIILEKLKYRYEFIDSKEWQKELLPKGTIDTKKDSMDIGIRLFPQFKEEITKHKDADGILIAEYCKRKRG